MGDGTDDFAEVVACCNLKIQEKLNLKSIVKKLSNKHSFVNKEETESIMRMEAKLLSMEKGLTLLSDTNQNIDDEVLSHTKLIKSTFESLQTLSKKREIHLIEKLNNIAKAKKDKLA